jgi:hypothetical protein
MLKREVEIGGEYAWQEPYHHPEDEYRRVTLLEFLSKPGGKYVLVADRDGDFETQLGRLVKPCSELRSGETESKFRTSSDKYEHARRLELEGDPVGFEMEEAWRRLRPFEPGKGGVPRVPEWLPRIFKEMTGAVLALDMGDDRVIEDEQIACHQMLWNMENVCNQIRNVAREMLPQWEAEDEAREYSSFMAENVRRRLDDGELPFASSQIMPVRAGYGMSRTRSTTEYHTGSVVAGDFMERVADAYEELDRYASLAIRWGWSMYVRWRRAHRAEVRPSGRRR